MTVATADSLLREQVPRRDTNRWLEHGTGHSEVVAAAINERLPARQALTPEEFA